MSAAFNSSALTTAHKSIRNSRSRSHDSLQALDQAGHRHPEVRKVRQPCPRPSQEVSKSQQVSRVELLLAPRAAKAVSTPAEDSSASNKINQAIKLSSQWTEIQQIILKSQHLNPSNLAFAMYRLGCLASFDSKKRVSDLRKSGLVSHLYNLAIQQLYAMDSASLVLLLDACARLHHCPPDSDFSNIATRLQYSAHSLNARQLSLVLWAFSSLEFTPRPEVLSSLEDAVCHVAPELSPQGLALVLGSFHTAKYALSELTMTQLADAVQRKLLVFKPSELATCLKALAALDFRPSTNFLQAIVQRSGGGAMPQVFGDPLATQTRYSNLVSLS